MSSVGTAFTDYQKQRNESMVEFIKITPIVISVIYTVYFIISFIPTEYSKYIPVSVSVPSGDNIPALARIVLLVVFIAGNVLLLQSKSILKNANKEDIEKADKYVTGGYVLIILGIIISTLAVFPSSSFSLSGFFELLK